MKTEVVQIRISPELKIQLKKAAEADNRTVSSYIETLILRDIESKKEIQVNPYDMFKRTNLKKAEPKMYDYMATKPED